MFDQLVECAAVKKKTDQGWLVLVCAFLQTVCLGLLVLIPLLYPQGLPRMLLGTSLLAPPGATQPPPEAAPAKGNKPSVRLIDHGVLHAPHAIPRDVAMFAETELPPESSGSPGGTGNLASFDFLGSLVGSSASTVVPPPPPPAPVERVKLGGQIEAAKILDQIQPVYPAVAIQARIQGNVVLHAIIDKDGVVSELQVMSGPPLLVKSAMEAVQHWRYKPTLLNGDAVEVDTMITVSFVFKRTS